MKSTSKTVTKRYQKRKPTIPRTRKGLEDTVRSILTKDALDKKRIGAAAATTVTRTQNWKVFGDDILRGSGTSSRTGNSIHLTGLSIKWTHQHTGELNATISGGPVMVTGYVIYSEKNPTELAANWYQSIGSDSEASFASIGTTAGADDARNRSYMNLRYMKILGTIKSTVYPQLFPQVTAGSFNSYNMGSLYVPLDMKLTYNTETTTAPISVDNIFPRLYFVAQQNAPFPYQDEAETTAIFSFNTQLYYRG